MPQYPFEYCIHCKRNTAGRLSFLFDNLGDDLLIILVAFALVLETPIWGAIGISLLHISFWMIYEVGYYENDLISATIESECRTPPRFAALRDKFSEPVSWVYAAVFGAGGIWAISQAADWHFMGMQTSGILMATVIWVTVLIALRLTYWAYSRIDKVSRVFLYLPLQVLKYGFPIGFVSLTPAGAALLLAQILRRWVPYMVYRYTGVLHSGLPIRALRLVIFVTGWLLLLPSNFADPAHYIIGFTAIVLLAVRAFSQFKVVVKDAKSVQADTWASKNS
ncbi:hypothetical protein BC777_3014 [Yoonia maricola]|uniref:Uncharacterized protein n=1 Tax=Yoonia maricola TaxID=420999 RepID=A0A2M8W287_9RHOB|nr:hypothetical protein [Yoonia maricola]PJI85018.1 hypothetical protein BC777_3014 [Yoonia maricola]